jgi:hypothetical protein
MYIHDGPRKYLTKDGRVVDEGDEAAVSLLVGEGGQLSDEDAEKYGLKVKPAPENKSKPAPANKGR